MLTVANQLCIQSVRFPEGQCGVVYSAKKPCARTAAMYKTIATSTITQATDLSASKNACKHASELGMHLMVMVDECNNVGPAQAC